MDWCGVRVSAMAVVQRPDPRTPLHALQSEAVAATQALPGNDGFRSAVQTALTMYLHQRACRVPLAVRSGRLSLTAASETQNLGSTKADLLMTPVMCAGLASA